MTHDHAHRFAQFIHDHDKRFTASVTGDGPEAAVRLLRAADGTEAATVTDPARYESDFLDAADPGPTVRAAWTKWGEDKSFAAVSQSSKRPPAGPAPGVPR